MSEIDRVIKTVKLEFPNVKVSQLTKFGEKPFESGVWKFWLEDNEDFHINVEVQNGMCYACYANKEFDKKDPNTVSTICAFFKEIQSLKKQLDKTQS